MGTGAAVLRGLPQGLRIASWAGQRVPPPLQEQASPSCSCSPSGGAASVTARLYSHVIKATVAGVIIA